MTAEMLHDALTLLPADLIAEADKKRTAPPRVIPWKRYAAMAACFALVFCCGIFCTRLFSPKGATMEFALEEAAAEAPMLLPTPETNSMRGDEEAAQKEGPADAAASDSLSSIPTAPAEESASTAENSGDVLCIDHAHHPAESFENEADATGGWCGNMTATVYVDGQSYTLSGSDAVTLTDILYRLDYSPDSLCRCTAQFTADTEMGTGYEINLTEYFVRFNGGQAGLTEDQAQTLRELFQSLQN